MSSITLPIHRAGVAPADLRHLWQQVASDTPRDGITIIRRGAPIGRDFEVMVNGRSRRFLRH